VGPWSFRRQENAKKIEEILGRFAPKYGINILSLANVGNHLHMQMKLSNRHTYKKFIRAITAAIAMAITGMSRWNKLDIKFWDYRPYTRVVQSFRGFLNLKAYIRINQLEGFGYTREQARYMDLNWQKGTVRQT